MVLTNEPGCYFIDFQLDTAIANPAQTNFFNQDALLRFRGIGGVRLEDVIAITENGVENFTVCPRTIEEVEGVMAGGAWPPAVDAAPELKRNWTEVAPNGDGMVRIKLA